jgi:LysM repeat protein
MVPGRTAPRVARLPASGDAADGEDQVAEDQVAEDEQQGEDLAPDPPASEPSSEPRRKRRRRTRLPATPQPPADVATGPSPWQAPEPVLIAEPASSQVRRGSSPWLVGALVLLVLVLATGIGLGAAMLVPSIADTDPPGSTIPPPAHTSTPPPPPAATPATTPTPSRSPSSSPTPRIHVVARGENLTQIATRYGVTVEAIVRANGIADPNLIEPGQRLIIPNP